MVAPTVGREPHHVPIVLVGKVHAVEKALQLFVAVFIRSSPHEREHLLNRFHNVTFPRSLAAGG